MPVNIVEEIMIFDLFIPCRPLKQKISAIKRCMDPTTFVTLIHLEDLLKRCDISPTRQLTDKFQIEFVVAGEVSFEMELTYLYDRRSKLMLKKIYRLIALKNAFINL